MADLITYITLVALSGLFVAACVAAYAACWFVCQCVAYACERGKDNGWFRSPF